MTKPASTSRKGRDDVIRCTKSLGLLTEDSIGEMQEIGRVYDYITSQTVS